MYWLPWSLGSGRCRAAVGLARSGGMLAAGAGPLALAAGVLLLHAHRSEVIRLTEPPWSLVERAAAGTAVCCVLGGLALQVLARLLGGPAARRSAARGASALASLGALAMVAGYGIILAERGTDPSADALAGLLVGAAALLVALGLGAWQLGIVWLGALWVDGPSGQRSRSGWSTTARWPSGRTVVPASSPRSRPATAARASG